jgi:adenine-specific DNA-methyltransferase
MSKNRDSNTRLLGFARQMRSEQTDAERKMWLLLRDRKLSGFKFRRQHPIGGYIVDFICIRAKLVVELDGGQHTDPEQLKYDARRTQRLSDLGIRVLRFDDREVFLNESGVLEAIYAALIERVPSPQPSPGVPGEGAGAPPRLSPSPGVTRKRAGAVPPLSPSPGTPGEGWGEGLR